MPIAQSQNSANAPRWARPSGSLDTPFIVTASHDVIAWLHDRIGYCPLSMAETSNLAATRLPPGFSDQHGRIDAFLIPAIATICRRLVLPLAVDPLAI
jgi:hypothetical protein